jgi:peptidoglycan-associated lipoprotein
MIRTSAFLLSTLLLSALLAACASQSTTESNDSSSPGSAASSPARPGQPGAVARVVAPSGKASVAMDGGPVKGTVYFDYDQFDVKPQYRPLIESHANFLRQSPQAKITLQGHGDERGSREYNLALGQKRSEAVRKMLLLQGARDGQVEAISYGEEKPAASGHDESAWSQNRRSEFAYEKR